MVQLFPDTLRIRIYYDECLLTNERSSYQKNVGFFYYVLENLPKWFRGKLNHIQLIALAEAKEIKRAGTEILLADFLTTMEEFADGLWVLLF